MSEAVKEAHRTKKGRRIVVKPISWAMLTEDGPPIARRNPKPKGSRSKGFTFQRTVTRSLKTLAETEYSGLCGNLHVEQWLAFCDSAGRCFAQPDQFIVQEDRIWLFECKLTHNGEARLQLENLYMPLLEHIFDREVYCVQVFKNLRSKNPPRLYYSLNDILKDEPKFSTWLFSDL